MQAEQINVTYEQIVQFCQAHHIRRLAFFGSAVRDDFGPSSDIDVLVEFEQGHIPGLEFFTIEAELTELLGRQVDLQTTGFLGPKISEAAQLESVTAYEQT